MVASFLESHPKAPVYFRGLGVHIFHTEQAAGFHQDMRCFEYMPREILGREWFKPKAACRCQEEKIESHSWTIGTSMLFEGSYQGRIPKECLYSRVGTAGSEMLEEFATLPIGTARLVSATNTVMMSGILQQARGGTRRSMEEECSPTTTEEEDHEYEQAQVVAERTGLPRPEGHGELGEEHREGREHREGEARFAEETRPCQQGKAQERE